MTKVSLAAGLLIMLFLGTLNVVIAQPGPTEILPTITIEAEGTINPSTPLISQSGNNYFLNGNVTGYSLEIRRSNVILDGAGYTLIGEGYNANSGIVINANNVTVKNFNIKEFGLSSILANGSYNTIEKCTDVIGSTIAFNIHGGRFFLDGSYNSVLDNDVDTIESRGGFNFIRGNNISWSLELRSTNNTVVGNNLFWFVEVYSGNNLFYLNNFLDTILLHKVNIDWHSVGNSFDNGSVGNFWSDYHSKHPNAEQVYGTLVGSIPYAIDSNNTDHYPLMNQVDISNLPLPIPTPPIPEFPITLAFTYLMMVVLAVGIVVRKHLASKPKM